MINLRGLGRTRLTFGNPAMCLLLAGLLLSGCRDNADPDVPAGGVTESGPREAIIPLEEIVTGLQPNELGTSADRGVQVSLLNEWADVMLKDLVATDVSDEDVKRSLTGLLDDEQIERVLRRQFVLRDATHMRDMFWARDLVNSFQYSSTDVADRVTDLFYHVVFNMHLPLADAEAIPLVPFDAMTVGAATDRDRAWTFGLLMKQLRIPTTIIRLPDPAAAGAANLDATSSGEPGEPGEPGGATSAAGGHVVVGVCLEGQLYLYDMTLGLPIPSPDDDGSDLLPRRAATLAQVRADGSLLRKLDVEGDSCPLQAAQFEQVRLELIGDTSLWSRRSEGLNNALTGDSFTVIHESLVSVGGLPGIRDAVFAELQGQVALDDIGVWFWPEQQREAVESLAPEQQRRLDAFTEILMVPYEAEIFVRPGSTLPPEVRLATGRGDHRQARILQISGRVGEAIPVFIRVQSWQTTPPLTVSPPEFTAQVQPKAGSLLPTNIRMAHALAAEQAVVWRAMCQIQQGNVDDAVFGFTTYLRLVDQVDQPVFSGVFLDTAQFLAGVCYARSGNADLAAAYFELVAAESTWKPAARRLLKRCRPAE